MELKQYFILNWKRFVVFVAVFSLSVFLYNYFVNMAGYGESMFLIVAVMVLPLYIIVYLILNFILWIFKKFTKSKNNKTI